MLQFFLDFKDFRNEHTVQTNISIMGKLSLQYSNCRYYDTRLMTISFTSFLWSPDSSAPCQNVIETCNSTCQLARLGVEPRNKNDVNEVNILIRDGLHQSNHRYISLQ